VNGDREKGISFKGKLVTDRKMRMFVKRHLPEYGCFGTADLFREKMGITLKPFVGFKGNHQAVFFVGEELNERFCDIMDRIADYCPSNIYDPVYIDRAIAHLRKEGTEGV